MAERVEIFDVECPALTAATAPVEVTTTFPAGEVVKVTIVIPDGHSGLTGIALAVAHQPLLPRNVKLTPTEAWKFYEGNDENIPVELHNMPDSGAWSAFLYNADEVAHRWQLRFEVNEVQRGEPVAGAAPALIPTTAGGELAAPEAPGEPVAGEPGEAPAEAPAEGPGEGAEAPPGELPAAPGEPPAPVEAPVEAPPPEPVAPPTVPEGEAPEPLEPVGALPELSEMEPVPGQPASSSKPAAKPHAKKPAAKTRTKTTHTVYPAGGWLPPGARYTKEREDQGQDLITDWQGPIVAPGDGVVVHNLSDRPFPDGFGPHYAVVTITTGRFAGHDWYVGHCTSIVSPGEHFKQGQQLARADQGHVQGGGWAEIGEAPGGVPGPFGDGAKWAHLFGQLTVTHTEKVPTSKGKKASPKRKASTHAPPKKHPAKAKKPAPHTAKKPAGAPAAAGDHGHAAPVAHHAAASPRPAAHHAPPPPPRRPPPPPPRPAPHPAPPPPRRRR